MSIETQFDLIRTEVHGRLYKRPAETDSPGLLLVGFHGYGEDAKALMAELEQLPEARTWSLATIQALHRFYVRSTGEIVASWMTRQDRLTAIEDNIRYVEKAVGQLLKHHTPNIPLVYVGFSQGTAMAYRAAAKAGHRSACIVALGGDVPLELAEDGLDRLPPVLIGRGLEDAWYSETKLQEDLDLLANHGVACTAARFDGGHEWTDEFRKTASQWIQETVRIRSAESQLP